MQAYRHDRAAEPKEGVRLSEAILKVCYQSRPEAHGHAPLTLTVSEGQWYHYAILLSYI
jgi:hypothetical protein